MFINKDSKKGFFVVSIFGISIVSGYVEPINEGLALHFSKKTAKILPYKNLLGLNSKIKPLKDYHIINLYFEIDLGSKNNTLCSISTAFMINYVYTFINRYFSYKKPYAKYNAKINVYEYKNIFNVFADILILFNLLMILLSVIKILVEKIIYEFRNKKRQNKQGC
jgi:hypothetical protein